MKSICLKMFACLLLLSASALAESPKILTNQLGYEPNAPKRAVILGHPDDNVTAFKIIDSDSGKTLLAGTPTKTGPVDQWKNWIFWSIDFTTLNTEGIYLIECDTNKGPIRSFPFLIENQLLERRTLSDVVYYFKDQRIVGRQDQADRHLTFEDSTDPAKILDLHGGWADATGDSGKHLSHLNFANYFNPQHIPLTTWALFHAYDELHSRKLLGNVQKRMLDEASFGADYLFRSKNPKASFYRSVDDGNPRFVAKDGSGGIFGKMEIQNPLQKGDVSKISDTFLYEVSLRCGAGISIAALASASTHKSSGEYTSAQYLAAAEDAYAFLAKYDPVYSHDGKNNIIDDYCVLMATTELFNATKKDEYLTAADSRAKNLLARLITTEKFGTYWRADDTDRPFFHAADAGLPLVALLNYFPIANDETQKAIRTTARKAMESEMHRTEEVPNPFGYARQLVQSKSGDRQTAFFFPHDSDVAPWWQGENARLASLATAARMTAKLFKDDQPFHDALEAYAANQLNWILGLNPFDVCMLHGTGRNSSEYSRGTYDYIGAPGGICNGITSGVTNPHDIDFNTKTDSKWDESWRWNEQWLPHSTWFMLAVAERE